MALKSRYWPLGSTALHLATGRGDAAMVQFLLSQGADVNATNLSGMTPLHIAVIMRWLELARLLLEHGAAMNATARGCQAILAGQYDHLPEEALLRGHD